MRITDSFPALEHRNFRLFWLGQMVSLIGTWMQNIGQGWLVLELTNSSFLLGLISAVQFLPMMLFSLFAGVIVDRFPKRKLILFTQSSFAVTSFILATLTALKVINYWEILILALINGFLNTIDVPARQSFIIDLVGKKDLMNAIALNSAVFNAARIIGPAIAGILIGKLGYAICFYLNSASFIAVIIGLILITVEGVTPKLKDAKTRIIEDLKDGMTYIKNMPVILHTILMIAVLSTFSMNFNVLVPVFTKNVLHREATGYGLLMSAMGIGALIGALTLASISKRGVKPVYLFAGGIGLGLFQILIGIQNSYTLTAFLLALSGWFMVTFTSSANTTIQINSADEFRGRVMSVYSLVFGGVTPIGSMYAGTLSQRFGPHITFIVSGVIAMAYSFYVLSRYRKIFSA
ncbi:MAG: Permeases of the major facilitator superfamily [Caldanaerobacter subterraneus]|uniref:Permeases of the major facilitator superfamily n=2 Tax=Caldanaerobacter subterraneus TaxID=911092 RepID=Q8R7F6_CALS4|nr:MFS transporter [Caldanaerobacter subterraneus]AAM25588.1 Permeases of the major facilitator superfamily [Caldanaerobacter subterraneus subsp. tengcongensis MB4]KUK08097.1 MAG: Permeases of the major facilitator superfamily [Caldanaerobacter subterraneus]MCS3917542.1 MFS family permease [Caldanaerobacter subterraneus subsp. tengcongensis MB4]NNG66907.1 MFS transporter [Caldanaerobacter subterraneus]TCO66303.1 putative MFS family arabinose efflux permease [Caldanaerobacter subterraneus]